MTAKNRKTTTYIGLFLILCIPALVILSLFIGNSHYHSDRLIVIYEGDGGRRSTIAVELTRYTTFKHLYSFQYTASVIPEHSIAYSMNHRFNSINGGFQKGGFVKNIKAINNENTLDEDFAIELELGGRSIGINLENMTGDFLINNTLERFTYVNMGTTTITVDGVGYNAYYAFNKTASADVEKMMMKQRVQANGFISFFSDGTGGLYYVDVARVYDDIATGYTSHSWALYKRDGIMKKVVGEQVSSITDSPDRVRFRLADFDDTLVELNKVSENPFWSESQYFVKGELVDDKGVRKIVGFSKHYDDRK